MLRSVKKKLRGVEKSLKPSKTFVGFFSHLDKFIIKAKTFSFILICKLKIVCFYVTQKTFEIFDPAGFLKTMKCLKQNILCKLASFAQNKQILCNTKTRNVCCSLYATFIKLRDSGLSFYNSVKKLL